MALASNALTTYSAFTAWAGTGLNGASQAMCEYAINVVSAYIENEFGRCFAKTTYTSEKYCPPMGNRLILRQIPIVSIASIVHDGSTVAATDYSIEDADAGFVWRDSGWNPYHALDPFTPDGEEILGTSERVLAVTYVAGYVTEATGSGTRNLPYDIEQAVFDSVKSMLLRRGMDHRGGSMNDENVAIGRGMSGPLTPDAYRILEKYRRWVHL